MEPLSPKQLRFLTHFAAKQVKDLFLLDNPSKNYNIVNIFLGSFGLETNAQMVFTNGLVPRGLFIRFTWRESLWERYKIVQKTVRVKAQSRNKNKWMNKWFKSRNNM